MLAELFSLNIVLPSYAVTIDIGLNQNKRKYL
jgi:hypothetical protein